MIECQIGIEFQKRAENLSKEEIQEDFFYGCRLCVWPNKGCEYFSKKKKKTKSDYGSGEEMKSSSE